jgi:hypothetical protein
MVPETPPCMCEGVDFEFVRGAWGGRGEWGRALRVEAALCYCGDLSSTRIRLWVAKWRISIAQPATTAAG